jgi:biofilm PGA synthesis N-glycosyltransferase PgaC
MTSKIFGLSIILILVFLCLWTGFILDFIYFYPLFMSFVWIIGGIYFYFHWERKSPGPDVAPKLASYPFISILIPCFNEGENASEVIGAACQQNYPNYEVIAINDGSSDNTGAVLDELVKQHAKLRVIHFAENQGKAMAMRMGAMAARGEYLVTVDGDAMLHPNSAAYLVRPMINNPRVGAVTGNPRIRTRVSLLGKVQVGEFSSIIGLIKRAQRIYGQIFTISGVIASFRRRTLHDCGYWDLNMVTEDIDISWTMQMRHWQIQYEPCAMAWILMPETMWGLWKQRLRWAQGGAEVFFKNITKVWHWRNRRIWMLVFDFCLSSTWAFAYAVSVILWVCGKYMPMPANLYVPVIWPPAFWGLVLATVSLVQFFTALVIESRYDHRLIRTMGWTIWYPIFFWALSLVTTLFGIPKAFFGSGKKRASWVSPDRGFR